MTAARANGSRVSAGCLGRGNPFELAGGVDAPGLLNSAPRSSQCAQIGGGVGPIRPRRPLNLAWSFAPDRGVTPARSSLLNLPPAAAGGFFCGAFWCGQSHSRGRRPAGDTRKESPPAPQATGARRCCHGPAQAALGQFWESDMGDDDLILAAGLWAVGGAVLLLALAVVVAVLA